LFFANKMSRDNERIRFDTRQSELKFDIKKAASGSSFVQWFKRHNRRVVEECLP
jgi:hypothetical protein